MKKLILVALAIMITASASYAQSSIRKLENVTIKSLDGDATQIPNWGEKNLIIFYVDPDRASQNQEFTDWLEESGYAKSDKIVGMGIMNLKDAPMIPNGLARKMANKRTEKNHATVLSDEGRILSEKWGLGDCNNQFVALIIAPSGDLLYECKGELSESDKADFLKVIDQIKK